MDHIDRIVTEHLEGLVVRKDLADQFRGRFSVPTYVGEFLIGKYCATADEDEIQEGLEEVERLLSKRVVRTGEHELFKAKVREEGAVQIIDIIKAKLDYRKKKDEYVAQLPSLHIDDALITPSMVLDNDRMLTGGFYAQIGLTYVPGQERPFIVTEVRPIQAHAKAGLDRLAEARELMTTTQWREFILRSVGLEASALDKAAQDAYFLRMVPFVVRNYNMVELGPRGTGKSHLFQQVSPYAYLLSGGTTTVAQLFMNIGTGERGLVAQHDVIAFDEVAGIRFKDKDGVNIMKGYMASGEFARGKESIRAEGGMAFLGNFEIDVRTQLRRGHLLGPMPEVMRDDTAFMDRLHAFVPGWDIPSVGPDQKTEHYGLVSDLLAQWWHELRAENRYVGVRERIRFNDSWRGRDLEAVTRTIDGLLKLLYPDPDGQVLAEDLSWAVGLATVARRRVKEAQAAIGVEEFGDVDLGFSIDGGPTLTPTCPESVGIDRSRTVTPPQTKKARLADKPPSKHSVFVSYSRLDSAIADELVAEFEAAGIGYWMDRGGIAPGAAWRAAIARAIAAADVVVVLLSVASNESDYVQAEVAMAVDEGLHIIPVRLDHSRLPAELRFELQKLQHVDATQEPRKAAFAELARHISGLPGADLS